MKKERGKLPPNPVNLAILMKQGVKNFRDAGAPEAYSGNESVGLKLLRIKLSF